MKSIYKNSPKISITRVGSSVSYVTSSGYSHTSGYATSTGNSDKLDGYHASFFSSTGHIHANTSWLVTQENHGYTTEELPIPIYWTSTGWQKAIANAVETLGSAVIVEIVDVNTFRIAEVGKFTIPNHGLEVYCFQYVSTSTAGVFVSYESASGLSNPLLLVEDENTIILYPYRPEFITEESEETHIRDTSWLVQQTNHGFTSEELPIPVYWTPTGWMKAKADVIETLGTAVIVEITNDNIFRVAEAGRFTIPNHGLEVECFQYVSTSTAGVFVVYEPVNGLSNLLAVIEDENTVVILPYRPMFIAETSTGGITSFINLIDAPHTYVGQVHKYVRVNSYETGLEFGNVTDNAFDVNTILTGFVNIPGFQSPGTNSLEYYGEFYFIIMDVDGNVITV